MTKNIPTLGKIALVALFAYVSSGNAFANEQFGVVGKGRVHFSGEIYQPTCRINVEQSNITSRCYEQGAYQQQSLSASDRKAIAFNNRRSDAQLDWLDSDKRAGILTVNYR